MKKIKNLLLVSIMVLSGGFITSCTDYQDEIDALDKRVTRLENLVDSVQTNLDALSIIADGLKNGDYITGVKETPTGYIINFKKHGDVEIIDGIDGQDAQTPNISIEQDPIDGEWYWTLNGEPIYVDGHKVRANGKDGKDGEDGEDGEDGADAISPEVRINPSTLEWEYRIWTNNGWGPWTSTGTSAQGKDGEDAVRMIFNVTYDDKNKTITIELENQILTIPVLFTN